MEGAERERIFLEKGGILREGGEGDASQLPGDGVK